MQDWNEYAKRVMRSEMVARGITYANLVELLADNGVKDTEANLRNKVSRGAFSAAFLFQCFAAMKVTTLHLQL